MWHTVEPESKRPHRPRTPLRRGRTRPAFEPSLGCQLAVGLLVALGMLVGEPVKGQTAPTVSPSTLTLQPSGDRASVVLQGRGVDLFTAARVLDSRGQVVRSVSAALGGTRSDQRPLVLSTTGARAGRYAVQLIAGRSLVSLRFALTIEADPPALAGLAVSPTRVEAGGRVTGTVQIEAAATTSLTVALSSSDPSAAAVPASVIVPVGSTSAQFAIDAKGALGGDVMATVEATLGQSTARAGLTIAQPATAEPTFQPVAMRVGSFRLVVAPPQDIPPFQPVAMRVGSFRLVVAPLDHTAPFQPVVMRVGTFRLVVEPAGGGR